MVLALIFLFRGIMILENNPINIIDSICWDVIYIFDLIFMEGEISMRIDAYNQISQVYQAGNKTRVNKTGKVNNSDRVEISQFGKEFRIAKQAVAEAPDVRVNLVNSVKERIKAGTYNVSNDELAAKLADNYFTNLF